MAAAIRLAGVSCHFGAVRAVDAVDLEIAEGEFFAMLGPSGSGKTTCLRLIAGFEQPTAGTIEIFGEGVDGVPPYARAVNTVFQDYALFPHMRVLENVAYGLKVKGVARAARDAAARAALAQVALDGLEGRKPAALSGGQRQRVALARALVNRPRALLLDEPLGALDLKLREQMQVELKSLQRELGLTFVFVTHDQGEALSMADQVAVFDHGRLVQVGAPADIYERPANAFVADFVGGANLLVAAEAALLGAPEQPCSLRPEAIRLVSANDPYNQPRLVGRLVDLQYQGATRRLIVALDAPFERLVLTAALPARAAEGLAPGMVLTLTFARDALWPLGPA